MISAAFNGSGPVPSRLAIPVFGIDMNIPGLVGHMKGVVPSI